MSISAQIFLERVLLGRGDCRDAGDHPGGRLFAEADGDFRSVFRQKDRMGGAAVPCAVQIAEGQSV